MSCAWRELSFIFTSSRVILRCKGHGQLCQKLFFMSFYFWKGTANTVMTSGAFRLRVMSWPQLRSTIPHCAIRVRARLVQTVLRLTNQLCAVAIEVRHQGAYSVPLSAILLTGKRPFSPTMGESAGRETGDAGPASFACVELFGQSILERTILRLQQAGVRNISVVASSMCVEFVAAKNVAVTIAAQPEDCWPIVERLFQNHVQRGTDTVLIADLGAYVEFDVAKALQFHMAKRQVVTPLHDAHTSLSYWFVDASQAMPSRALALPPDEDRMADRPVPYLVGGYVNRLADGHDFRRLVVDVFFGRTSITPSGREI